MPFHVIISLIFRQACHCPPIKHHICFYFIKKSRFPQIFINSICLLFTILVESPRYIQLLVCQDDNPPLPLSYAVGMKEWCFKILKLSCGYLRFYHQATVTTVEEGQSPPTLDLNCRRLKIEWPCKMYKTKLPSAWLCKRKVAHFLTLNNSLFIWWKKNRYLKIVD